MIYELVSFSDDISVYSYHVESNHDICRAQKYSMNFTPSSNRKKDSSDFSFSYNRKIYFMVSKIYFYVHASWFGTGKSFFVKISLEGTTLPSES